jgi:hypothetical protein
MATTKNNIIQQEPTFDSDIYKLCEGTRIFFDLCTKQDSVVLHIVTVRGEIV